MGLDLTLGGLVLLMGVRGWLRGFTMQALRLAGLVASAYAAVPARDQIKPYAVSYFPTIRADLVDRLLWWASAAACYFVIVGVGSLMIAVSRRQPEGLEESRRGDQFAGLGLGVLKGALVATFLLAGLQRYAAPQLAGVSWANQQIKESVAWKWGERYHPAERIWSSPPVQEFVSHVKRMGLNPPPVPTKPGVSDTAEEPPVQTASRSPRLAIAPEEAPPASDGVSWGLGPLSSFWKSLGGW